VKRECKISSPLRLSGKAKGANRISR